MGKRRRRSDIGRLTRNAKRMRLKIRSESEEERALRLSKSRMWTSMRRAAESAVEREARLLLDRDRHKSQRARESPIERNNRLLRYLKIKRSDKTSEVHTKEVNSTTDYVVPIEFKVEHEIFIEVEPTVDDKHENLVEK